MFKQGSYRVGSVALSSPASQSEAAGAPPSGAAVDKRAHADVRTRAPQVTAKTCDLPCRLPPHDRGIGGAANRYLPHHGRIADTPDDHVLAGIGVRADEPVHRTGRHPSRSRSHHRVRRREFVGGQAEPVRLHRGTRRPRRTRRRCGRAGCGRVLDRLHHRDRTRVPQADYRATRVVHPADVPGAHRRGEVLRAATAGDRRHPPARRHRRGQRGDLPGAHHLGCTVRAHRLL